MSGGSYNYLCFKTPAELMAYEMEDPLAWMIDRLAKLGYAKDAAQESMAVLAELRAAKVRVGVMADRLSDIWRAVEWWDSGDSGEDILKLELAKYRGQS